MATLALDPVAPATLTPTPSPWLTTAQAAAYAGRNVEYMRDGARAGEIPAVMSGGRWRFHRDHLNAWLLNGYNGAKVEGVN